MRQRCLMFWMVLILSPVTQSAQAGLVASSTRLVFQEGDPQHSLTLLNVNDYPVIVQTWVDNGEANPTPQSYQAPYVALPSVFKLSPKAQRSINVVYNNAPLPDDRESVFWLNLYEIPPSPAAPAASPYQVTLAMNMQLKVFYRPARLKHAPDDARHEVDFALHDTPRGTELHCHNRSAFYVSFGRLYITAEGQNHEVRQEDDMMAAPFSTRIYTLNERLATATPQHRDVAAEVIDDAGKRTLHQFPLAQ